jgi:hypothetical protein
MRSAGAPKRPGEVLGHRQIARRRDLEVSRVAVHHPYHVTRLLGEHRFVGGLSTHPQCITQDRHTERLRCLRQIDPFTWQRGGDRAARVRLLDRIVRLYGRDGST